MRAQIDFSDRYRVGESAVEVRLSEEEWLGLFRTGMLGGRMVSRILVEQIEIPLKENAPSFA